MQAMSHNRPQQSVPGSEIVLSSQSSPMPTDDTSMQDAAMSDSPTTTDDENMSSENDYTDDEKDIDMDPYDISSRVLERHEHLGEVLALAFPNTIEYEDDEQRDIFDDGLSGDESSDSDISTNYEELTQPDIITRLVFVSGDSVDKDESSDSFVDNEPEDAYDSNSDTTSADSIELKGELVGSDGEVSNSSFQLRDITALARPENPPPAPKTFTDLQKEKYQLLYHASRSATEYGDHPSWATYGVPLVMSLDEDCDRFRWRLLSLEETKSRIELEIVQLRARIEEFEKLKASKEDKFISSLENSGISESLYEEYEAFCESLNPPFGQRGGFSITCHAPHNGSYVKYDPEFLIFKECIEMPYSHCNFRCEASVEGAEKAKQYVVEFWPIKPPEPLTGKESTWGEQYPDLYNLAMKAVRNGSEAAMEMLIALPDANSSFNGGWIFDYEFEKALKDSFIVSQRWRFRSAHKIDAPVTVEGKRKRLELMLRPEMLVE